MKPKSIILLAFVALFLCSCSGVKVTTDLDKTVDFTKYKSLEYYGWADNSDKILNRLDKDRIENAFEDEFKKRGMNFVETGGDLVVTLYIVTKQKTRVTADTTSMGGYGSYYHYGPGYGWGSGHSTTTYSEYDYTVGTLLVSVYDAAKKELIWEARGKGTIDKDRSKADERVPKAVAEIMSDYPVAPRQ